MQRAARKTGPAFSTSRRSRRSARHKARASASRARGVIARGATREDSDAAVAAIERGYLVLAAVLDRPAAPGADSITHREHDVPRMLAQGLSNKRIAERLALSEHTVKFHVASSLSKLGAATRTETVTIGVRRGLIML
ncbi:MAG: hypothetical protein NVSMB5_12170 [Candidatus Velthaea sp.]